MINELVPTAGIIEDYEDRAGYILATFCADCAKADQRYRAAHAQQAATPSISAYVELSSAFALCDVFAPTATYYLAAVLVMDENEEMSEKFFALYSDSLSKILSDLPMVTNATKDCYHLL